MKKNKIMSIGLFAILSLSFIPMLFQNNVYAQTGLTKITGFDHDLLTSGYSNGKIWVLAVNGTTGSTANNWLYEVNATSQTVDELHNVTRTTGNRANDMWCSPLICYITDGNGSNNAGMTAIDTTDGSIEDTINQGTVDNFGVIAGRFSTSGEFSLVFYRIEDTTLANTALSGVNSIPEFGTPFEIDPDIGTGIGVGSIFNMFSGETVDEAVYKVRASSNLGGWALSDFTECSVDPLLDNNAGMILNVVNSDGVSWTGGNPDLQELYITGRNDGDLVIVKDLIDFNPPISCNDNVSEITTDKTDLSSNVLLNGIILENHNIAVVQEAGATARLSIMPYNNDDTITDPTERFGDSLLVVNTNPADSQNLLGRVHNQMNYNQDTGHIFWVERGSGRAVVMYDVSSFQPPSIPEEVAGIDCSLPENLNILICRLTETTGGNIGGLGGIIDTGLFSLFTNSGIIDGDNTDPQTNGIGYFITITGFGVMTAMFFIATKGRLNEVPTFIWMLSAIALLGAITAIGWLDPTFLIIGIIAVVALASMQIRNTISSGLDFGRGDF